MLGKISGMLGGGSGSKYGQPVPPPQAPQAQPAQPVSFGGKRDDDQRLRNALKRELMAQYIQSVLHGGGSGYEKPVMPTSSGTLRGSML